MKKIIFLLTIGVLCFVNINEVNAHSGRTDSSGCHTCKTNCAQWGLNDNEYHCHSGNTYTNSKGQTFYSDGTIISSTNDSNTQTVVSKSSDNTIKSVKINNEQIDINNNMEYKTKEDMATIEVVLNDVNASAEYDKKKNLIIGNNSIIIKVKAD